MNNFDLFSYDYYIVAFSGGKDSMACVLHLLDQGVDKSKIELWHHDIDGEGKRFMDWPCTKSYCQAIANALGVSIYFSWKEGGFLSEMLRENTPTAPTVFETPNGRCFSGGDGKKNTRLKFPQVSADLSVRWCSAYLKIDICASAIRNQKRFENKRVLVLSGERGQESAARSHYSAFEPDRSDNRNGKKVVRHVDRWRPVHQWSEHEVWAIIERWKINPHPAYHLGWGRCSCLFCIFGSNNQWASAAKVNPKGIIEIAEYEELFEKTIHRTTPVMQRATEGNAYESITPTLVAIAMSEEYNEPCFLENWTMPAGAFGESCGPI